MTPAVEAIARAVLYEGYILYPYRSSALTNHHRWSPGGLAPGGSLQCECLAVGGSEAILSVRVRFLRPLLRTAKDALPTHEATECEVEVPNTPLGDLDAPRCVPFAFPPALERE